MVTVPEDKNDNSPRLDENNILRTPIDYSAYNGTFGSPAGSKTTLDATYLLPAIESGLVIKDRCIVKDISSQPQGGYKVRFKDLVKRSTKELSADIVIVAAGTMNSLRILMASKEKGSLLNMGSLGKGFGVNGDCIGLWLVDDEPVRDSCSGTPVQGRVKIKGHEDCGYFIISGSEPLPVPSMFAEKKRKEASASFKIISMAQDASNGTVSYDNGRLIINYDAVNDPAFKKIFNAFRTLEKKSGWPVKFNDENVFTAHPLGGARIANNANAGVVNGQGEVYDHPGLYIADASVFPKPLGLPPSLSIAAWAAHVAAGIVNKYEKQFY